MHKLVQYFQSLYTCWNEDTYELKGVHISNFEVDLCSSSVEYCSISNVDSLYQCSCKQCCSIAVYAMCYSVNQSISQSTLFKHGKWLSKLVFRHAV